MGTKITSAEINIEVSSNHPLIRLANIIDWTRLYEIIIPDLKATTFNGKWWLGRKLKIRIHLGIYILQNLYNLTDRKVEYNVKDNAAYQLFCGIDIVDNWHCPDHTIIEVFRSRLSPNTQNILANEITKHAVKLGFADSKNIDVDSVSEANMAYPSDSHLLLKLGKNAYKLWNFIKDKVDFFKNIRKRAVKAV